MLVTLCAGAYLSSADVSSSSSLFCGCLGFIRSDSWLTDGEQNKNKPKLKQRAASDGCEHDCCRVASQAASDSDNMCRSKCVFQRVLILAPGGAVVWNSCCSVGVASQRLVCAGFHSGRTVNV